MNNSGKTGAPPPSPHQLLQAPTGRERKKKVHVLYNKTCMYTHTQIYIFTYVYTQQEHEHRLQVSAKGLVFFFLF